MRQYLDVWLTVAIVMGVLLGLAEWRRNALNDPDPAWQRTGILLSAQTNETPADLKPRPGHRAIIFFARTLIDRYLFHDLADQSDLMEAADLIVGTPDGSRPIIENGIQRFVMDPDGSLARAVGLHRPMDDGPPVGYVLVDSHGSIRYRTLDSGFGQRAWEMKLLLRDLP